MSAAIPAGERISVEQMAWLAACLALALLAYVDGLPLWVTGTVAACAALRLILAARGRPAPPRPIRLLVSLLAIGLLFLQFRTFNGLSAGTTLLCLIAGLKLLETNARRDVYVVTMIIYFLGLGALLQGESFWLLAYLVGVSWLTTATLLRLTSTTATGRWRISLRYAGRLLAQALPLALAFWLFFPRFGGPLWQLPDDGGAATSGLSDSMSPGDITELAASDEVAFRVRFSGGLPPSEERYWRGPVLHEFDGRTWRRGDASSSPVSPLQYQGRAYEYTISLEPSQHPWLFMLDWPARWSAARAGLTSDYMLIQSSPVTQPVDVVATSYTHAQAAEPLSNGMRRRDTARPPANPRTVRLAAQMRNAHPDDLDYVHAVLEMFRQEPFYYTLTPPRLAADSVDGFLFDSKRGFCGHYASAFATLMRAVGIPARVVTGYQGGTYNRFADYWIVRQSDAHAWDEIWIDGHGWLRTGTRGARPQRHRGSRDAFDEPLAAAHPLAHRHAPAPRCIAPAVAAAHLELQRGVPGTPARPHAHTGARRTEARAGAGRVPDPRHVVAHLGRTARNRTATAGSRGPRVRTPLPQAGGCRHPTPAARGCRGLCRPRRGHTPRHRVRGWRTLPALFRSAVCRQPAASRDCTVHRRRALLQAARFSRVFMKPISGQRSSVKPRLTRVGAR
jgi:transglutaminase-like putative cysteine protease